MCAMRSNVRKQIMYKTRKMRYALIKLLSPTIFNHVNRHRVSSVPRGMVDFLQYHYGKEPLIGVEIGVYYGSNALSMLKLLNIKKLYLIDSYKPFLTVQGKYIDPSNALFVCIDNMLPYGSKVQIIHDTSEHAASDVPDNLDFVYIDGNHNYDYVKQDLELYYPKIRSGGVLGGHDFTSVKEYKGVIDAVTEFIIRNKLRLHLGKYDWWVIKDVYI